VFWLGVRLIFHRQERRSAPGVFAGLDVYVGIANHPRRRQIKPMRASCIQQHAGSRFPATAGWLNFVRAVIDCVNRGAGLHEMIRHSPVQLLQVSLRYEAFRDTALVGNNDDAKPGSV